MDNIGIIVLGIFLLISVPIVIAVRKGQQSKEEIESRKERRQSNRRKRKHKYRK